MRHVSDQLVEGYSQTKKCSDEGRALMSLDVKTLQAGCRSLLPGQTLPMEYVDNYIRALYLPSDQILEWAQVAAPHAQMPHAHDRRTEPTAEMRARSADTSRARAVASPRPCGLPMWVETALCRAHRYTPSTQCATSLGWSRSLEWVPP